MRGARHRPGTRVRTDHERAAALDQGRCASAHPGVGASRAPRRGGMTHQDRNSHVAHSAAFDRRDLSMATPSSNGFTQIWNALIADRRLTAPAFRIAAYLGSKPEDWTAREHDIRNALGLGHDAYLAAMRQLVDAGYVARGKTTRERGRIRTDAPQLVRAQVVPKSGQPTPVHRTPVTRPVTNTEQQQKTSAVGKPDFSNAPDRPSKAPTSAPGNSTPGASEGALAPERPKTSKPVASPELCPLGCNTLVPGDANPDTWVPAHLKIHHPELIAREPWNRRPGQVV
jgi:hypothetical protein